MDVLKTFDTFKHYLFLAKLKVCRLSLGSLKSLHIFLWNRKQIVQLNNRYNSDSINLAGVLQDAIVAP